MKKQNGSPSSWLNLKLILIIKKTISPYADAFSIPFLQLLKMSKFDLDKGFISKIMNDQTIHEIWKTQYNNGNDSFLSFICSKEDVANPNEFSNLSCLLEDKEKYSNLQEEIKKKNIEFNCFKNRFFQTIQKNYRYQKIIKEMDEVLENVILGVNDILRFLKLGYMSLEEFESSFQNTDFSGHNPQILKISEYVQTKFKIVLENLENYRHVTQLNQQVSLNEKLMKKNQSLIDFINKRKQYTDSLKSKIENLKTKRNQALQQLEEKKAVLQKADQIQLDLELKYINRNQLTNILRNLLRRVINHQSTCFKEKLEIEQIQKMIRKNEKSKENSPSKLRSSPGKKKFHP